MRLIDADALMGTLAHKSYSVTDFWNCRGAGMFLFGIEQAVNEQPTIDAVPIRHGMFVGTEYDGFADGNPVYYEWKCSECGCVFEEEEPTYRYCPQCGARMDEE